MTRVQLFVEGDGTPELIQLGQMRYAQSTGRLTAASGEDVLLRWQSAQVLQVLARHLGTLVTRDDLMSCIWGDVAVTDDSLTQCIADIRRALGDHDRSILTTLPKRGFILNGQGVSSPVVAASDAPGPAASPAPPPLIVADLDPRDIFPTVAVLPMQAAVRSDRDPIGIFVADQIIAALSQSDDMSVISRLSTLNAVAMMGPDTDLRELFDTDFVVSGSVRHEGDRIILSVEFAESESRQVVWADRYQIGAEALVTDTSWVEHTVASIRKALMVREVKRVQSVPVENLKLYSLLHGAVGLMHRLSARDFDQARRLLTGLQDRVPHNPAPRAWLARWHVLRVMQGWSEDAQADATAAMEFAESALDIDPENVLSLNSLGFVMTNLLRRLDDARAYYDAALELCPNDPQGRALRGMMFAFSDQATDGKRDAERALHLTPRDPHRFFYLVLAAGANLSAGDYDRAVTLATESRRLNRTHVSTLRTLAAAQAGAGKGDAARRTVAELMRLQPDLTVRKWQAAAPSRDFDNGRRFAALLKEAGVPH